MNLALPGALQAFTSDLRRRWRTRPRLTPPVRRRPVRLENRDFTFIGKLDATRRRYLREKSLYALGLILSLVVPFFTARCVVDWWLEMPWGLRLACLLAEGLFIIGVTYRYILWPRLHPPSDEEVALMVERRHSQLRSRLISTLQLNQPGGLGGADSPTLVRALTRQTEEMVRRINFARAVSLDRAGRLLLRGLTLLFFVGTAFYLSGETGAALARRAILSPEPVPRKTQIEILTERHTLGIGENITLRARAGGVIPEDGEVLIEYASGREQSFDLTPEEGSEDTFARLVQAVPESFEYTVYLGDARSEPQVVNVRDKPVLWRVRARYQPPPYTGQGPRSISLQELDLLPGSTLFVAATSRQAVGGGTIDLRGPGDKVAMQPAGDDPTTAEGSFRIPTEGLSGFSVRINDREGVPSSFSPVYPVQIVEDKAPSIEIVYPVSVQQLITPEANLLLSFRAEDDYRLGKVLLRYTIDGGEVRTEELDLGERPGALQQRRYDWDISRAAGTLELGTLVQFWFEVADTNTITGPGQTESRRFVARVVSREEKIAELRSRTADSLENISTVASGQREASSSLGEFIQRKEAEE